MTFQIKHKPVHIPITFITLKFTFDLFAVRDREAIRLAMAWRLRPWAQTPLVHVEFELQGPRNMYVRRRLYVGAQSWGYSASSLPNSIRSHSQSSWLSAWSLYHELVHNAAWFCVTIAHPALFGTQRHVKKAYVYQIIELAARTNF